MKLKEIIIATGALLILSGLLAGCKIIETAEPGESEEVARKKPRLPQRLEELIQKATSAKKEVDLVLSAEKNETQIKVTVSLDNPNQKALTSVQTWLSYDPEKLKGVEVDASQSAFLLVAPYNNTFDDENGLVMVGRSNTEPITDVSVNVATITFERLVDAPVTIDAYDYRNDLTGHMSANTLVDGAPYNLLTKPDSPALIVE